MTEKTNFPNPLLRGGPSHIHYDRDNTTTTALGAGAEFLGEWQTNTAPDVRVEINTSSQTTVVLEFSDDNGTNITEERLLVAPGESTISRSKGPRSFRIRATNSTGGAQTSFSLYTYYGDFGVVTGGVVLAGTGGGLTGDPFTQDVSSTALEDLLRLTVIELRINNAILREMADLDINEEDLEDAI
jgi:hypothetical protein